VQKLGCAPLSCMCELFPRVSIPVFNAARSRAVFRSSNVPCSLLSLCFLPSQYAPRKAASVVPSPAPAASAAVSSGEPVATVADVSEGAFAGVTAAEHIDALRAFYTAVNPEKLFQVRALLDSRSCAASSTCFWCSVLHGDRAVPCVPAGLVQVEAMWAKFNASIWSALAPKYPTVDIAKVWFPIGGFARRSALAPCLGCSRRRRVQGAVRDL
jgi:hypothetical protein